MMENSFVTSLCIASWGVFLQSQLDHTIIIICWFKTCDIMKWACNIFHFPWGGVLPVMKYFIQILEHDISK